MNDAVIETDHLTRQFGDFVAVESVSFQVRRGAIFGLLGPNGSGKSTIIRMLLGVLPPSAGQARLLGEDAFLDSERIKGRVGYMAQGFTLYGDLSVRENIEFFGRVYALSAERLKQRLADVVQLTSLEDYLDQPAGTLSGGWQRRLALACALVHEPDIVFLDEPTAGIDPVARRHLWDLLFELSGRGVTLFVTTHYMDEAERCTDVGYIYLSRLLVVGKPGELKRLSDVTPEGTCRYELRVPDATKHLMRLRHYPGVRDATLFGETIHLLLDDRTDLGQLVDQAGGDPQATEFRRITPSLEDVFVALTAQAEEGQEQVAVSSQSQLSSATSEPLPDADEMPSGTLAEKHSSHRQKAHREKTHRQRARRPAGGFWAVMVKEFFHIRRQPVTLFFMLVVPVMQTIIFGYAIDTQIEHIPTVVFDLDGRRYARDYVAAMVNTRRFDVVDSVTDENTFQRALSSGRAKVGIKIPPQFTDRTIRGEQVQVQVLIDGSDSQVATTAQSTAQLLGLNLSIERARAKGEASHFAPAFDETGHPSLPIETRTRLLYNPDLESAHFFVPGLIGIILQLVTLFLTSFAVVREREQGTLEQLFVTPVGRLGLLLGKLVPYALLGFVEVLIISTVMIYVFGVAIAGSLSLLLILSMLFMVCSLGLGLFVSTIAKTQLEAMQFAFVIMLPSVLLSGFMFPRSEMPLPIYLVTFLIPVTYFIEILRGIVLRGADFADLIPSVVGLSLCCLAVLAFSVMRFQKRFS